jgi:hypothetical protein
VVDTFVEMFEMEIVEKKGTSCRRLSHADVSFERTRVTSHKMIACRCVIRTHTSDESQDDSMPMCHSNSHE